MEEEKATTRFRRLRKTYGVNGSTYTCFTHRSSQSTLTVLYIKKYPQLTIIHVALSLSVSCVVLLMCTMHVCRGTRTAGNSQIINVNTRTRKTSKNIITFHWSLRNNTARKLVHVWIRGGGKVLWDRRGPWKCFCVVSMVYNGTM